MTESVEQRSFTVRRGGIRNKVVKEAEVAKAAVSSLWIRYIRRYNSFFPLSSLRIVE